MQVIITIQVIFPDLEVHRVIATAIKEIRNDNFVGRRCTKRHKFSEYPEMFKRFQSRIHICVRK